MENLKFNEYIAKSIKDNWDLNAFTDYKGQTLQYKDVARKIEKFHILFEYSGINKGDKIALAGRNSSHWAVTFLAILTYGAVAVPILHEFTVEQVYNIVNHSDARLLFVGDTIAPGIKEENIAEVEGIIYLPDFSLHTTRSKKLTEARESLNELFGRRYPKYFRPEHICYYVEDDSNELALINYTSGTTGFSKGVMIPYRALWSNYIFAEEVLGDKTQKGDKVISILPMAHMYGMAFEFIFEFLHGMHIHYLSRVPSPVVIAEAFTQVKPRIVISVPLIIEKIIRKRVFPKIQGYLMRLLLGTPFVRSKINRKIKEQVSNYNL